MLSLSPWYVRTFHAALSYTMWATDLATSFSWGRILARSKVTVTKQVEMLGKKSLFVRDVDDHAWPSLGQRPNGKRKSEQPTTRAEAGSE